MSTQPDALDRFHPTPSTSLAALHNDGSDQLSPQGRTGRIWALLASPCAGSREDADSKSAIFAIATSSCLDRAVKSFSSPSLLISSPSYFSRMAQNFPIQLRQNHLACDDVVEPRQRHSKEISADILSLFCAVLVSYTQDAHEILSGDVAFRAAELLKRQSSQARHLVLLAEGVNPNV
ncbi:hypothetical protein KC367_g237 [Hortaea werneckii]|nr:hypothetical protein KC367_g237 [Hortaea werneckii]